MDGATAGLVGGIAGSVIGVMGGVIGTWASIANTNGPRERALMIRASALGWVGVTAFLAVLFLIPHPWNSLLWLPYGPLLLVFSRWVNKRQALARAEDEAEGGRA